jgi:hypothetical protein
MSNKLRTYLLISLFLFLSAFPSRASQESASNIPEALVQQLIKDINTNDNGSRLSDHDLEILRKNLKCKLEDINGDGTVEYFLYIEHPDWCGAGTNCDYWVYQDRSARYNLLLNEKQLSAKRTKTNGYRDLVSETPMGVIAPGKYRFNTTLYKYDGKQYREVSSALDVKEVRKKN